MRNKSGCSSNSSHHGTIKHRSLYSIELWWKFLYRSISSCKSLHATCFLLSPMWKHVDTCSRRKIAKMPEASKWIKPTADSEKIEKENIGGKSPKRQKSIKINLKRVREKIFSSSSLNYYDRSHENDQHIWWWVKISLGGVNFSFSI